MKKLLIVAARTSQIPTPISLLIITGLTISFWFSTTPKALAQTGQCTLCHKLTTTLMFDCDSLDYRRHRDHGDTIGACAPTPTTNP